MLPPLMQTRRERRWLTCTGTSRTPLRALDSPPRITATYRAPEAPAATPTLNLIR